jgi:hypothetical protein
MDTETKILACIAGAILVALIIWAWRGGREPDERHPKDPDRWV